MVLLLVIVVGAVGLVVFAIRSAKKRQQGLMSQAMQAIQSSGRAGPDAGIRSSLTDVHADGTPMSPEELQAFQGLADAGFTAMNGNAGAAQFTKSSGAIDPALAGKVRAQLDAQGFGKLGEMVAQQMQNMGNGGVTVSVGTSNAADTSHIGRHEPEPPPAFANGSMAAGLNGSSPFGSSNGNDPFASPATDPFAAGNAFGGQSASVPPSTPAAQSYAAPGDAGMAGGTGAALSAAQRMGTLGVAQFVSVTRAVDGSASWSMDRERVGRPLERVTAPAVPGVALQPGERVYVNVDPNDGRFVTLAANLPAGFRILSTGNDNRADPLVIGPALRTEGERATGTVKAAEHLQILAGGMPSAGSWRVTLEVAPERGFPFTSDIVTTFSTQERADAVTRIGAVLPLFFDPQHPKTIAIDAQSMGFADR